MFQTARVLPFGSIGAGYRKPAGTFASCSDQVQMAAFAIHTRVRYGSAVGLQQVAGTPVPTASTAVEKVAEE